MLQYTEHLIIPHVEKVREMLEEDKPALAVLDNFKGQVTESVISLLDAHNNYTCLLPPNTTDNLQPLDIAVNKPAKEYIKKQLETCYSEQVIKQLEGHDINELETIQLQPIDLHLTALKEIGAKWLVDMAMYIGNNPQFIANRFVRSGITGALDGYTQEQQEAHDGEDQQDSDSDSDIENDETEDDKEADYKDVE